MNVHLAFAHNSEVSHTKGNGKLDKQTRKAFKTMVANLLSDDKAAIKRQHICARRHRDAAADLRSAGFICMAGIGEIGLCSCQRQWFPWLQT